MIDNGNIRTKNKKFAQGEKITQSELAESVGVDFTYISKIENDKGLRPLNRR